MGQLEQEPARTAVLAFTPSALTAPVLSAGSEELTMSDLERSTFQNRPAYRYIRQSDHMPALGAEVKMATVKLFNPTGAGTWYLSEYDANDRLAFGASDLGYGAELGYIGMAELVEFRGRFGLPIERDLHFTPCLLSEVCGK